MRHVLALVSGFSIRGCLLLRPCSDGAAPQARRANVKRTPLTIIAAALMLAVGMTTAVAAEPKGAKAIFDSGEGSSIAMSSGARPTAPAPVDESRRYVGISYQILQLMDNGEVRQVSKSRVFRGGERVKLVVRTNRPGYLTVMNVGPTGNTAVLFNDYVEGFSPIEVPRSGNLRFVGAPGTERLFFMLSNEPNPLAARYQGAAAPAPAPQAGYTPPAQPSYSPPPAYTPPPAAPAYAPPASPTYSSAGSLPPPPPMVAYIDGAKGTKGAKDLVAEDSLQSSYTVLSPKDGFKPRRDGMKDLMLESQGGTNYGVVPVSTMVDGGILTLDVSLRHN
jgi:hypothetical protein